ncbi:MAG: hypothetical protein ABJC89_03280 [Acidobacteriota bacterium]
MNPGALGTAVMPGCSSNNAGIANADPSLSGLATPAARARSKTSRPCIWQKSRRVKLRHAITY